jgi:hypothetical protein
MPVILATQEAKAGESPRHTNRVKVRETASQKKKPKNKQIKGWRQFKW